MKIYTQIIIGLVVAVVAGYILKLWPTPPQLLGDLFILVFIVSTIIFFIYGVKLLIERFDNKPKQDLCIRDWNIRDALEWWEKATGLKMEDVEALDFFRDLRQEASDGHITVWGRPNSEHRNPSEYTEPMPPYAGTRFRRFFNRR